MGKQSCLKGWARGGGRCRGAAGSASAPRRWWGVRRGGCSACRPAALPACRRYMAGPARRHCSRVVVGSKWCVVGCCVYRQSAGRLAVLKLPARAAAAAEPWPQLLACTGATQPDTPRVDSRQQRHSTALLLCHAAPASQVCQHISAARLGAGGGTTGGRCSCACCARCAAAARSRGCGAGASVGGFRQLQQQLQVVGQVVARAGHGSR